MRQGELVKLMSRHDASESSSAKQGRGVQPATSSESESEDDCKPQLESEGSPGLDCHTSHVRLKFRIGLTNLNHINEPLFAWMGCREGDDNCCHHQCFLYLAGRIYGGCDIMVELRGCRSRGEYLSYARSFVVGLCLADWLCGTDWEVRSTGRGFWRMGCGGNLEWETLDSLANSPSLR